MYTWSQVRNARIVHGDNAALHAWIENFIGPSFARAAVCQGHRAPFDVLSTLHFDRPSVLLVLGPRGGGKSLCAALAVHLDCRYEAQYAARIMGGSEQQSKQIYNAIAEHVLNGHGRFGSDRDTIQSLLKREAKYHNGSHVAILPASSKAS